MKKRMAGLIAVLLMTTAGTAIAEQRAGAFTLSPFVGGYTFDGVQHLETRPVYGLRLGYDITKNFGIEATFDYVNTKFTGGHGIVGGDNNVNLYNARLEGIYNFMPESKFVPFVALGAGFSHLDSNQAGTRINNDATAQAGIGFKYFMAEDVALRLDGRVIGSFHATPAFEISKNEYWLNYEYTLGVQFLFGGKKPVVAKVEPPPPPPAPKVVEPPPPPPAPVDGKVGAWSEWSACSAPCGGGTQTRTRPVITEPANGGAPLPALSESRSCNTQACKEEPITILVHWQFDRPTRKDPTLKQIYLKKGETVESVDGQLEVLANYMKKNPGVSITLDGWTDSIGKVDYNNKLSQRRADAIKDRLVTKFKIDAKRITAKANGVSTKYDNKTDKGREQNRRTEAVIERSPASK